MNLPDDLRQQYDSAQNCIGSWGEPTRAKSDADGILLEWDRGMAQFGLHLVHDRTRSRWVFLDPGHLVVGIEGSMLVISALPTPDSAEFKELLTCRHRLRGSSGSDPYADTTCGSVSSTIFVVKSVDWVRMTSRCRTHHDFGFAGKEVAAVAVVAGRS